MNTYFRSIKQVAIIGLILSIISCKKVEQLTGKIVDNNKNPIENALVEVVDESIQRKSTTDGLFKLAIKNIKDTNHISLKITAKNYLDKYIAVDKNQLKLNEVVLTKKHELADQILNDEKLSVVKELALKLLSSSNVTAGGGYPEIWIRDLNTFVEAFLNAGEFDNQKKTIKKTLLHFLKGQDQNYYSDDGLPEKSEGSIADQYNGNVYKKISVETDQETSLILTIDKYVQITRDSTILKEIVNGQTVLERVEKAIEFLYRERWAKEYGLIFGAVTVDWGDISPDVNNGIGANLRLGSSHIAVDIYDNAMLSLAITKYIGFLDNSQKKAEWKTKLNKLNKSIQSNLWDEQNMKFYPHLYLNDPSPYASGTPWDKMKVDTFIDGTPFNENKIYFHGGTGIAIKAGLLNSKQIAWSIKKMRENVKKSNSQSIGLTLYPPYPQNIWTSNYTKNRIGQQPYYYQNGGDWTWFGARIVSALAENGFIEEAYSEIQPMLDRVIKYNGFYEWWHPDSQGGLPIGHGDFRGSAGVLFSAIVVLEQWANKNKQ